MTIVFKINLIKTFVAERIKTISWMFNSHF
jgi:hypothetical protein